jgi:hypothetical protein
MVDDTNKEIAMPPLPEEPADTQEPQIDAQQEEPVVEEKKNEEQSDSNKNFAAMRAAKAKVERERDAAYQRLQELERMQNVQSQAQGEPEPGDDELVEWKHVKRTVQGLEKKLNSYQQSSYEANIDARIKSEFPDFEKIVSTENVNMLRDAYPELAGSVGANPDLYARAVSAYKLIKQFGIHQEDNYSKERDTAQKNAAKPRPLVSANPQQGESPLTRANAFAEGLTDSLKKQLREEMEAARRGY